MKKGMIAVLCVVAATALVIIVQYMRLRAETPTQEAEHTPAGRMVVYDAGRSRQIDSTSPAYAATVALVREILTTADSAMRLAIVPKQLSDMRRGERALELLYAKPLSLVAGRGRATIMADRIFVPLSGELAEDPPGNTFVLVFYGVRDYGPGPFHNGKIYHDRLISTLKSFELLSQ